MMKKFFLVLLGCLTLSALFFLFGLPYALGFVVEHRYRAILSSLAGIHEAQVTLASYKRGWFSSDAEVRVLIPDLNVALGRPKELSDHSIELTVNQHIQHGFLLSTLPSRSERKLVLGQAMIDSAADTPMGSLKSTFWIHWNGKLSGWLDAPLLRRVDLARHEEVLIRGLSTHFIASADLNQLKGEARFDHMNWKEPDFTQRFETLSARYVLTKIPNTPIYVGDRWITLAEMGFGTQARPDALTLKNISFQSSLKPDSSETLTMVVQASAQQAVFSGASYGPHQMDFTISRLYWPALLPIFERFNVRQGNPPGKTNAVSTGDLVARYRDALLASVSHGLSIQIDRLSLMTPWGRAGMTGFLRLNSGPSASSSLLELLHTADADMLFRVSPTLFVQMLAKFYAKQPVVPPLAAPSSSPESKSESLVSYYLSKGWLVQEGGMYRFDFRYHQGKTTLNGLNADQ